MNKEKMSETADNEVESISGSSFDDSEADTKTRGSSKGGSNVLRSLKEDNDTFCAIKSFLIAAFIFTCAGVAVAAHFVTSDQEESDFEQSVRADWRIKIVSSEVAKAFCSLICLSLYCTVVCLACSKSG